MRGHKSAQGNAVCNNNAAPEVWEDPWLGKKGEAWRKGSGAGDPDLGKGDWLTSDRDGILSPWETQDQAHHSKGTREIGPHQSPQHTAV